jgi:leucyl aminopeptidase (aminopeptidase T)
VGETLGDAAWARIAAHVLRTSLGLRRGRSVLIETWQYSLHIAEVLAMEARRMGVRPVVLYMPGQSTFDVRSNSPDSGADPRVELAASSACDAYIRLPPSLDDLRRRDQLPVPHRRAWNRQFIAWSQALRLHSIPSVHLVSAITSPAAAKSFHVDVAEWERECVRSTTVDPRVLRRAARPLLAPLERGRTLRITQANGTSIELGLVGHRAVIDDGMVSSEDLAAGHVWTILPSGFLTVPLQERTAEGVFVSNRPSQHFRGAFDGARWTFRRGRLTDYAIEHGASAFESIYRKAGRERDRPALLTVGLNPEIRDFPLAEDQELGVVTLYIGRNEDWGGNTRGQYRDFALLRGADVYVDDQPIIRAGHWRH